MHKFWAALAMTSALVASPAAQAETLADALISAYKTSHLLDQNQAVLRAADEDAAIAVSKLRPVLDFTMRGSLTKYDNNLTSTTFTTPFYETSAASAALTASILIYAGGRGRLGVDVAHESVLATRSALINVEQQVLLSAVSAYVNVRLQGEIVALRQSNMRLIEQELRAAKDRFDVGEVTLTDVSLADAALASARAGLATAQGNLQIARERYKAAIGHYPANLQGLPRPPQLPKSQEAARAIAVRNHPSVIQAQHEVKIGDLRVQIAKAGILPTISGNLTTTETDSGLSDLSLGLNLTQPIYQGGGLSALYRQSVAQKEISTASLHQTVVTVSENVGNAWTNLSVANANIQAGSLQITATQKAFDGVREEAKLGARTTLDVLNAEQDLLDARALKLQSEASRYVGIYQVLSTTGQLTATRLNLGIATFDPEAYYNAVKSAPATSVQGKKLDRIMAKIKR
ncbi:MAG: TolC family outer membrane protein [Cypionkella sp.]